jgi:hypothetical protein
VTDDEFHLLMFRALHKGEPVLGVRNLPMQLTRQIAAIALTSKFLGERGNIEFDCEVDADDNLIRVEWTRADDTRTVNIFADGKWFSAYKSFSCCTVVEVEGDEYKQVDTETMEAIMLMVGMHPTQL